MNVSRITSINRTTSYRNRYNVSTTNKITSIKKNNQIQKRSNIKRVNSLNDDIVSISYFVGKGIIAFTFLYTSLNYFHYKRLREQYEEQNKDDDTNNE